ncbi:uncharacterized protein LOC134189111 isoform X2 [Corticium candelabrum]|uniref:uncharacterized protein LOC134189111 isoform X2 n=1 Tax=Corticium candelabrum TaxID=121492 RepID=UPI002E26F0B9|nr:uncharacterized protein LOC134189111 isoform X2 [Corticium candelabrum]
MWRQGVAWWLHNLTALRQSYARASSLVTTEACLLPKTAVEDDVRVSVPSGIQKLFHYFEQEDTHLLPLVEHVHTGNNSCWQDEFISLSGDVHKLYVSLLLYLEQLRSLTWQSPSSSVIDKLQYRYGTDHKDFRTFKDKRVQDGQDTRGELMSLVGKSLNDNTIQLLSEAFTDTEYSDDSILNPVCRQFSMHQNEAESAFVLYQSINENQRVGG